MSLPGAIAGRASIAAYVRRCQTEDGGFFFARVPPGTATDTYHAVCSLALLGDRPADENGTRRWIREAAEDGFVTNPRTIFHLVVAARILGVPKGSLGAWAGRVNAVQNPFGAFGAWRDFDREVTSELETTFFAVSALADCGLAVDRDRVREFVLRSENSDGGFGRRGCSTLASTRYAAGILTRVGIDAASLEGARSWLSARQSAWDVFYLEELYWLVAGLQDLGVPVVNGNRGVAFVLGCQHPSGGFSRTNFGIPTLENTHYAVQLLRWLDAA